MACKEDEGGCVTLTWEIQNFGLLEENSLSTPFWKTEHTAKSVWRRLRIDLNGSNIEFNICRAEDCLHLDSCQVSLISSSMEVPLNLYCRDSESWYYTVESGAAFGEKRQSILPNETLTLRCKMWEKTMRTREFCISSVLHSFSYLWNIEKLCLNDLNKCSTYIEEENFLFKVTLEKKSKKAAKHNFILADVSPMEHCVLPIDCNVSDKDGGVRVIRKNLDFDEKNSITNEIEISRNRTSLKLQLESVFAVHKFCQDPFELHSPPRSENVSEAVSGALGDHFLLLYRDKLFSDTTLNAEGTSFPVHRIILAARSPVFRAVFEKDEMSEGRSGVVDIDDVDSETVDRMLVYLYGDSVGSGQQWEEAAALYYAADKYDIQPLKRKCADSLKEGLTADNACEALVLADRHSDDQLMKCVVDFIRQNEEVLCSEKWDGLQNSNSLLAAKVLRELYVKIKKK